MRFRSGRDLITIVYLRRPIMLKNHALGLAGLAESKLFPNKVGLVVDYRPDEDRTYDYACATLGHIGDIRLVMEPEVYLDFLRGKAYARTSVMHELGHIHHRDLTELNSSEKYNEQRLDAIRAGGIMERELKADDFAVRFLGAEVVSTGLSYIRDRDAEFEDSVAELNRRISRLVDTN